MRRWPAWLVVVTALAAAQVPPSGSAAEDRVRFLTSDPRPSDYWPCFSPDGTRVLFSRSLDGEKTWELFVVPRAGGEAKVRAVVPSLSRPVRRGPRVTTRAFTGTTAQEEQLPVSSTAKVRRRFPGDVRLSEPALYRLYPTGRTWRCWTGGEQALKRVARTDARSSRDRSAAVLTGMASVSPDENGSPAVSEQGACPTTREDAIWLLRPPGLRAP